MHCTSEATNANANANANAYVNVNENAEHSHEDRERCLEGTQRFANPQLDVTV